MRVLYEGENGEVREGVILFIEDSNGLILKLGGWNV